MTTATPMRLSRAGAEAIEHERFDFHDVARLRFAKWLHDNGRITDHINAGYTPTAIEVERRLHNEREIAR